LAIPWGVTPGNRRTTPTTPAGGISWASSKPMRCRFLPSPASTTDMWTFGSHTISPIAGWTDLSPHINVTSSLYVFGKLATATNDPMPTATYSGSTNFWCYSVAFAGASSTLVLDSAKGDRATNSVSTIPGLASTPTPSMDNCLGIWWGGRNKTTTSNGATLSTSNANYVFQKQLV